MIVKVIFPCVFALCVFTHSVRAQTLSDVEDLTENFLYNNTLWPVEAERDTSGKASWFYDKETASIDGYYAYELDLGDSGPSGTNWGKKFLTVDSSMTDVLLARTPAPRLDTVVFEGPTPIFSDSPPPSLIDSSSFTDASGFSSSTDEARPPAQTATPEPGTFLMVGLGLAALGLLARRRSV